MTRVACLLFASCLTSSCYLTKQGYHQVGLLISREPIEEVLREDKISQSERKKLELTNNVLSFARAQGLDVGSSYKDYVPLERSALSYMVQAARPTELKLKTWWFPIVGSVPYLGFFDQVDRDAEAKKLLDDGYEVHQGAATAFSSLGWFSDPVYSSMLRRSDAELASLYFHELTHRTVWLRDGVEFNENLAEFVADELTEDFFAELKREGELEELRQGKTDDVLFRVWLTKLRKDLEENLNSTKNMPADRRVSEKNKIISLALLAKPKFKRFDIVGLAPWNNARILAASLYSPDTENFVRAAKCFWGKEQGANMGRFLKALEKSAEKTSNGFESLELMCAR